MPRRTILISLTAALGPLILGGTLATTSAAERPTARSHQATGAAFEFVGRGFGHGVGMSQYGARGRALAGWSHQRILRHYYRGTTLSPTRHLRMKILLADELRAPAVTSPRPFRLVGRATAGPRARAVPAGTLVRLVPVAGGIEARRSGARPVLYEGAVRVETLARAGVVSWGERRPSRDARFRGSLRFTRGEEGGLRLVNYVFMEDYLRGVVPAEMPASWGDDSPAALRAQAIAARTYALATLRRGGDFNHYADTRSQVYEGVAIEDPRTDRAVRSTANRIVTFRGEPAQTFFFSTSGGRTEDVVNAFPGSQPTPYLVSVPDPFDRISPVHRWPDRPRFSPGRLGELLGLGGPVTGFEIVRRGASPRVVAARVTVAGGRTTIVSGSDLRGRLGLRDSWFAVRRAG
ncbi:MAG: SpoIID/LytB domain-containing protein [Miltoncostaeaceae bacterium]